MTLRVVELFAGIGAQASALERLGIDFKSTVCEIDPKAYRAYCAIHGDTPNLGDITQVERLPDCDLVTYSFPCLAGDTLVQTNEGWKPIKDVTKGNQVMTDDGYRTVTDSAMTGVKPVMTIKSSMCPEIRCTEYHPFLVRKKVRVWNNSRRSYDRVFSSPEYVQAKDLTTEHYVGCRIPEERPIPEWNGIDIDTEDFWWKIGKYVADGWRSEQDAPNIHIHEKCKALPKNLAKALLDGYLAGDGNYLSDKKIWNCTTVSKQLAMDLVQLIAYVYERPASLFCRKGRTAQQHDVYQVRFHIDKRKQDKAFFEDGWVWSPINKIKKSTDDPIPVYDITVEDRHCFVCNGIISSNCQDLSVAGMQRGMVENSGTRSALLWEVGRLLQEMKETDRLPETLLMENVDAIINKKNIEHFERWCKVLEDMGYCNSYQVLNAKDYGVPQSRKRVFMVSSLSKGRFVFPDPIPLTRRLKDVLEENVDESFYLSEERIAKYEQKKKENREKGYGFDLEIQDPERERVQNDSDEPIEVGRESGDRPSESQGELGIVVKGLLGEGYLMNNSVYDPDGIAPTQRAESHGNNTMIEVKGNLKNIGWIESACRVYGKDGIAPTLPTCGGGGTVPKIEVVGDLHLEKQTESGKRNNHANDVLGVNGISTCIVAACGEGGGHVPKIEVEPNTEVHEIIERIRVRTHEVDTKGLSDLLRTHKESSGLSTKEIAEKLSRPITEVEHWFRTDDSSSIPDPGVWYALKDVLGIKDDSFDAPITEFTEKEGVFEKSQRAYGENGISPTIATDGKGVKIVVNEQNGGGEQPMIEVSGMLGKSSQHFRVYNANGIAPTLTACDYKDPLKIEVTKEGENNE